MKIWLSPEILEWNVEIFASYPSGGIDFFRPYRILEHAKKKLIGINEAADPNEENLELGDAIKSLREVIENRENRLRKKFNFEQLPYEKHNSRRDKKPTYKFLLELGITQPIMQKKLVELRNKIVHRQIYPLNKEKNAILELWEFVWYFIRATDSFLGREITSIIFYPDGKTINLPIVDFDSFEKRCVYVFISEKNNWQINILGRDLPSKLFSQNQKYGWIEVEVEDFNNHEDLDLIELVPDNIWGIKELSVEEERENDEMRMNRRKARIEMTLSSGEIIKSFQGDIVGPPERLKEFVIQYVSLYMYY